MLGREAGTDGVALGHDAEHAERCRQWLAARKAAEHAFDSMTATDIGTLTTLARAAELADADVQDLDGTRRALSILITGETGTGKELLARAIHAIWARSNPQAPPEPVILQVAGMPRELISAELFGQVKGAFTGSEDRTGRLEVAKNGTLLIDEVGDLPHDAQVGLLRFLQDGRFSRLGRTDVQSADVRVLAATWHDLEAEALQGKFRADLLHRLRVARLHLPPLRDRRGAVDEVVPAVLAKLGHKALPPLTRAARDAMAAYPWPGNMRELVGVLRAALPGVGSGTIRLDDLPREIQQPYLNRPVHERAAGFICDEVDGQPLTAAVATRRSEIVATRIAASIPMPPPNPDIAAVHTFLSRLPDEAAEHVELVQRLNLLSTLDQAARRWTIAARWWHDISDARLPEAADAAVKLRVAQADATVAEAERQLRDAEAGLQLDRSPWWRLWNDLRTHPLLVRENPGGLFELLVVGLNIVNAFSPKLAADIRGAAAQGGLRGLWEAARGWISELDADRRSPQLPEHRPVEPSVPFKQWTPQQWRDLVAGHPSKDEACRQRRISQKTVDRYLTKLGIEPRWGDPAVRSAREGRGRPRKGGRK
jgi:DNA-binding NtrC family response regulator